MTKEELIKSLEEMGILDKGFVKASNLEAAAAVVIGWAEWPEGWTKESAKKFWDTITEEKKHKRTKCIEKMSGSIDNPGAFCNSLYQMFEKD